MTSRHSLPYRGQALAEAVLVLGVAGVLLACGSMVGRLQDLALQTRVAARHLAFAEVAGVPASERARLRDRFFPDAQHRWRNHDGSAWLPAPERSVDMHVSRDAGGLPEASMVGGGDAIAAGLRPELLRGHQGWVTGTVAVLPDVVLFSRPWLGVRPRLESGFAILADAGHALDDADAQRRLGAAPTVWSRPAAATERAGRPVATALARVDRPWGRPAPRFDWLSDWAGLVPGDRLGGTP